MSRGPSLAAHLSTTRWHQVRTPSGGAGTKIVRAGNQPQTRFMAILQSTTTDAPPRHR